MPNWCEGSLRLRGKKEEICRFIENQIVCYKYNPDRTSYNEVPKDDWLHNKCRLDEDTIHYVFTVNRHSWLHIKDTQRAFPNDQIDVYSDIVDYTTGEMVLIIEIKQAWSYLIDDWDAIAKAYDLDMKLFGYESGMGFEQRLTYIRGKEPVYETIDYDDWWFECSNPELGG